MPSFRASRAKSAFVVGDDSTGFKDIISHRTTKADLSHHFNRMICQLPSTADEYYKHEDAESHNNVVRGFTPQLELLLSGIYNDGDEIEETAAGREKKKSPSSSSSSPLGMLRGHESTILRKIYGFISNELAKHVKLTIPAALVGNVNDRFLLNFAYGRKTEENAAFTMPYVLEAKPHSHGYLDGFVAFSKCGQVKFPPKQPPDIGGKTTSTMVTMMPFILGNKDSLPEYLQRYFPLIEQCPYMKEEIGMVAYLTVHESVVDAGETQRRPGIHTMPPGFFRKFTKAAAFTPGVEHPWGMGGFFGPDRYEGGIYCASSVNGAIEVWDALVDKNNVPGVVESTGSCDHFCDVIGPGTKLKAGELIWMTDCTPMAELPPPPPVKKKKQQNGNDSSLQYRQFFSVVMPYISDWYEGRWTPNPKVKLPQNVIVICEEEDDNQQTNAASINTGNYIDPIR